MKVSVAEQHCVDFASSSNQSLVVHFIYILSFIHFFFLFLQTNIIANLGGYFHSDYRILL